MKIAIKTLGCKVNQSESASIAGELINNDYEIVQSADNADICIINTCTVTAKSDYQSRQLIRKSARSGAKVIVTGCYAQLRPDDLVNMDGVSRVIGNSDKNEIADIISDLHGNGERTTLNVKGTDLPLFKQTYHSTRSRAFLKIQDGCNKACAYCSVRLARGKSRSLSVEDVLSSAVEMEKSGYREIVLTGVHIGSYGHDLDPVSSISDIVDKLSLSSPGTRFRLSSLEPGEINAGLLSLLKRDNICSHLHIPLQSGSDKILKSMNRGYSTTKYKQVINRIIKEYPDIAIGTDVIVGFPGESDKDFQDTYRFVEELPFSYLHVFPYSRRSSTKASHMPDQINGAVKRSRVNSIIELSQNKKLLYLNRYRDRILNVIIESSEITSGNYIAISDNYIKLTVKGNGLFPGDRVRVRVISLTGSKLLAQAFN
ncbi:MAG: tRNA (N(6)-L-threonylcarbamoyladenosine(37)-C(2))-methylthiotransferase MtaB [Nitrospiraceae bacterium]|nr:MAG: tRNA (N(6)-L-threonylcarbamoyladenosine(37)-C(2))-methylthiotransferase MtaB [Nitrospiraceae bacterium]